MSKLVVKTREERKENLKDVFNNGTIDQIGITASKVNKLNKLFDGRESVLSSNFVGIQENSDFSKEFNNIPIAAQAHITININHPNVELTSLNVTKQ